MFSPPTTIDQFFFQLRFFIENRIKEIDLGKPRDHAVFQRVEKPKKSQGVPKITWDYSGSFAHSVSVLLRNLKHWTTSFHGRASPEQKAALARLIVFVDDNVKPLESPEGSDRRENLVRVLELIREFETGLPGEGTADGKPPRKNQGGRPQKTPGMDRIPELEAKDPEWFSWPARRMAPQLGCAVSTLKQSPLWQEAMDQREAEKLRRTETRRRGRNG